MGRIMYNYWVLLFVFISFWCFSYAQEYAQILPQTSGAIPMSISASASAGNPSGLVSGTSTWNAGTFPVHFVQFDFGRNVNLYQISLLTDQSPPGTTSHTISGGTSSYTQVTIASFNQYTTAGQYLTTSAGLGTTVRYIRITTNSSPSWVAWSKVFVYAYYRCVFYGTPTLSLVSNTPQRCFGTNSGSASIAGKGGSGTYTYQLDEVSQGAVNSYTTLTTGSHTGKVYDSTGCYGGQVSWTTGSANEIIVSTKSRNQTCAPSSDGWIHISATGGAGGFYYAVTGSSYVQTNNFTNLAPTSYTWYARDANSCIKSGPITVNSILVLSASPFINTPIACAGGVASFTINAAGGAGGYTYLFNGGTYGVSNTFSATAGNYNYYVKDANGCTFSSSFTITQNSVLQVTASSLPSCYEGSNGVITLAASGGTGEYTYLVESTTQSTNTFTGLSSGTYLYTVQDTNGCTNSSSVTIQSLEAIQVSDTVVGQQCAGTSTGSIVLTASGGSNSGFQFSQNESAFQHSGTFQDLSPGIYEYLVKDDYSCTSFINVEVPSISEMEVNVVGQPQKCASTSTGVITFDVQGGAGNYNYSIDDGASYYTTAEFSGLEPATYQWRVQDENGCEKSGQVQIDTVTAVTATYTVSSPIMCNGETGSISISASGGVGGYSYSLDGVNYDSLSNTFTVAAGSHEYYVQDANQCTFVGMAEIAQNSVLGISATSLPSCFDKPNGGITVSANGGAGGYDFKIGSSTQSTGTFVNLYGGNYTYEVTDANGCFASSWVSVVLLADIEINKNVVGQQCHGTSTGSVVLTVSGGSNSGFEFSQNGGSFQQSGTFQNLSPGPYEYTVQDDHSCAASISVEVPSISDIEVNVTAQPQVCASSSTGVITFDVQGGTGNYNYSIDDGASYYSTAEFSGLEPATYHWRVQDENGCEKSGQVEVASVTAVTATYTVSSPIMCNGETGSISISASGGVGGYSYSLDGVNYDSLSNTFTVAAGSHEYYVQDANQCTFVGMAEIAQNSVLGISATSLPSCFDKSNGGITVSANGGAGGYDFKIGSITQSTGTFVNLYGGNYTYEVTDANGCFASSWISVVLLSDIEINKNVVGQQCHGTSTGSVVLTVSGGSNSGFEFSQNGGSFQQSGTFQNLSPGPYEYTVQDDHSCAASISVEVPSISDIEVNVTAQPQVCASSSTGVITFDVQGGTGNYNYSIDDGASYYSTAEFSKLEPATYHWRVQDENGCEKSGQVEVASVTAVTATYTVSSPIMCNGETGSISISASGGVGGYSYSLDGVDFNSANIFNVRAGKYSFYVQDANQCPFSAEAEISENPVLQISATSLPSCFDKSNGGITVTATGGAGDYEYTVGSAVQNTGAFVDLYGGNYTYTVTDKNGCVASDSILVVLLPAIEIEQSVIGQQCFDTATGSVTLTASGGSNSGFEFSQNGSSFQQSGAFQNLSPGPYEYVIQDDYSCAASLTVEVSPISDIVVDVTSQAQLCALESTGTISFSVIGGAGTYSYSIDDGESYAEDSTFTGLAPATYNWKVKDANGCEKTGEVEVASVTPVSGGFSVSSPIKCHGNNGSIAISATGGVGNYSYSLDGIHFVQSNEFGNLPAGDYTFYIRDGNECLFTGDASILQNPPVSVNVTSTPNTKCTGTPSGTITFSAAGGTGSFSYQVTGSAVTSSPNFIEKASGRYSFIVKDSNECEVSGFIIVGAGLGVVEATVEKTDLQCFESGDSGSVTVTATSGTTPYEFSINDGADFQFSDTFENLAPGSYSIITRDANLCTYIVGFDILRPTAVNVTVDASPQLCFGSQTGSVSFYSTGGRGDYQYTFNNGTASGQSTYSSLNPGDYFWEVSDASNCVRSGVIAVQAATAMDITYSMLPTCSEKSNGQFTVSVSGGAEGYSFSTDNVTYQSSPVFTDLTSGIYTLYVKDRNGCINSTTTIQISSLPEITTNATIVGQRCSGTSTGEILLVVSGGIGSNYTYSIDGLHFLESSDFTNLLPGTYNFAILDSYGCSGSYSAIVPSISEIIVKVQTSPACFESENGQISIVATGGAEGFSYSLDNDSFASNNIFSGLSSDNYIVYVKDANECYVSHNVFVDGLPEIIISAEIVGQKCNGTASGSITLSSVGGNQTGFQYSTDGDTFGDSNSFTDLLPGVYSYFVQDNYGCKANTSAIVPSISGIEVSVSSLAETCYLLNDGSISFTATGGAGNYTHSIDNGISFIDENEFHNLEPGVYNWIVKDSNHCEVYGSIIVANVTALNATIEVINPLCFNETGSIVIQGLGGVGGYTYSLDDITYDESGEFDNLFAGEYDYWVQDSNGCKYTETFIISENPVIQEDVEVSEITCFGTNSSLVQLNATGGTGKYEYSFNGSPFSDISSFNDISPGTYTYEVRDENQCSASNSITITQPDRIVAEASAYEILCGAKNNTGSISISNVHGGHPPYYYSIDGINYQSSSSFYNLSSGEYSWYIQDSSECVVSDYIIVPIPSDIPNPQITSTSVISTEGGLLTITGTSFVQPITIFVDGEKVATISEDTNEIVVQIGEGTGSHTVDVVIGEIECGYVATANWSYLPPVVNRISVITIHGGNITIEGEQFGPGTIDPIVTVNGLVACESCEVNPNNTNEINCLNCTGGHGSNNTLIVEIDQLQSEPFVFSYLDMSPAPIISYSAFSRSIYVSWAVNPSYLSTSIEALDGTFNTIISGNISTSDVSVNVTVNELMPNTMYLAQYEIQIWEINPAGAGNSSQVIASTLAEAPGKPDPAIIVNSTIDRYINISWQPPYNGGSDIILYNVLISSNDTSEIIQLPGTNVSFEYHVESGLQYQVNVKAVNNIGEGEYSDPAFYNSPSLSPTFEPTLPPPASSTTNESKNKKKAAGLAVLLLSAYAIRNYRQNAQLKKQESFQNTIDMNEL